jgi:hypothetical protein
MRMAGSRLGVLALALSFTACGDDGKVGSKDFPPPAPPAAPAPPPAPAGTPAIPPAPAPAPGPTTSASGGWRGTRAGDRLTWEVRTAGSDAVTRLTWTAERVAGGRVEFRVESRTTAADGREVASSDATSAHDLAEVGTPPGTPETVQAAGRSFAATKAVRRTGDAETTVWTSADLPLSGVVRSTGPGGVEQVLVSWSRGS